jgi:hypothetical protein
VRSFKINPALSSDMEWPVNGEQLFSSSSSSSSFFSS